MPDNSDIVGVIKTLRRARLIEKSLQALGQRYAEKIPDRATQRFRNMVLEEPSDLQARLGAREGV